MERIPIVSLMQLRGHIPHYALPDREAWLAQYGPDAAPIALPADEFPKFSSRAAAAYERDLSALDERTAVLAQTQIAEACEAVQHELEHGTPFDVSRFEASVFYDPHTKAFWLYPTPPRSAAPCTE